MPTPRKHVSHLAENTRKQNVKRYETRANEPKSPDLELDPPKHLSATAKAIWTDVVSRVPPGILQRTDALICEVVVQLTAKMRSEGLTAAETGQLRGALQQLGMTPADRSRVPKPTAAPTKSRLDKILDGDDDWNDDELTEGHQPN